jgi:hypothetical protein
LPSTSTAQSDDTRRTRSRAARNGGTPATGFSRAASSRAKRSRGTSPVVPCTLASAMSRTHAARCASSAAKLSKARPATALRFT